MASPDRDLQHNQERIKITGRAIGAATETVLVAGSVIAALTGGYRAISEWGDDREARGAITRGMELDPKFHRPSQEKREEAVEFVKDLVSGIDSGSEEPEAYAVAGKIITSESELERQYATLSQEKNYKDAQNALIKAVDADNLDDRNLWTALAGTVVAAGTLMAASATKSSAPKNESDFPEDQ